MASKNSFFNCKIMLVQIDNHLNLDNTIVQSQSLWLSVSSQRSSSDSSSIDCVIYENTLVSVRMTGPPTRATCLKPGTCMQRWKAIVTAINKDPYARGRVIFDILNEPDAYGLRWETSNNAHVPSITTNYLRFMDMASSINHSALPTANTRDAAHDCCDSHAPPLLDARFHECYHP